MLLARKRTQPRAGFSLVELLIVIVIIGILISMISVAAMRAFGTFRAARLRTEITQLSTGLGNFKSRFNVAPPSRLVLAETRAAYAVIINSGLQPLSDMAAESLAFLERMFPRNEWENGPAFPGTNTAFCDWNGNGRLDPGFVVLEGDQVLVFSLGGLPAMNPPTVQGFSTNPRNPTIFSSSSDRIGPFYAFDNSRLVLLNPANPNRGFGIALANRSPVHFSYLDTYGSADAQGNLIGGLPYAYLSSNRSRNGYFRFTAQDGRSDCATLNVLPYAEAWDSARGFRFLLPDDFQIIAAGLDGRFGPGSIWAPATVGPNAASKVLTWTPVTASSVFGAAINDPAFSNHPLKANLAFAADDAANFSPSALGNGQ